MLDVDGSHDPEIIGKALEELKQAGYNFNTAYQTAENGDQVVILRDMVVNGKSLNFTKTTDAEGNTKLIWGNYEKQAEGAPSAYDMVYGTEYEYEGKTYTIVWGYESQNNPNTTAAAGVLDAFGPDSNVKVTGDTHRRHRLRTVYCDHLRCSAGSDRPCDPHESGTGNA